VQQRAPQFERVKVWSQSKINTYICLWVIIISCLTMGKAFGWGTFLQMLGGLFSHLRPLVWVYTSLWVAVHLISFVITWDILIGEFFPLLVCFFGRLMLL
jgi:hypothetical protein